MRYAKRRDVKHFAFITDLRKLGFSVADTSLLGHDFPDLVIGKHGVTALVEIKTLRPRKHVTYAEQPNEGQVEFAAAWRGSPVILAYSVDDVLDQFRQLLKKREPDSNR